MFVKIMHWNVTRKEKLRYTGLIKVETYSPLGALLEYPSKESKREDVILSMEFQNIERSVSFPRRSEDRVVEVYFMNDQGETIDKHIY